MRTIRALALTVALVALAFPVVAQPIIIPIIQSTVAGLPAGASNNAVRIVTDGNAADDCATGGGTTHVWCVKTGAGWVAFGDGAGSGGGGDVTAVGDCTTGDCFQAETATHAFMAPIGGGVATFRAITDADIPNNITIDLATLATTATTALAGDSATGFFPSGTIEHERGGLEADVSAFAGLLRIAAGSTTAVTSLAGLNTALGSSIADGAHTPAFVPNADPGVDHASYVAGHGDGADCDPGFYARGVDAAGNAQGCTADADTFDGYTPTGDDLGVVTGTAGGAGVCAEWNADGDLVAAVSATACGAGGGSTEYDPDNAPASGLVSPSDEFIDAVPACTWGNQQSATWSASMDTAVLDLVAGNATEQMATCWLGAPPAGDWTVVAKIGAAAVTGTGNLRFGLAGLIAGTVATPTDLTVANLVWLTATKEWANQAASFNSYAYGGGASHGLVNLYETAVSAHAPPAACFRIQYNDAANTLVYGYSWDCMTWADTGTRAGVTTAPSNIGIFASSNTGATRVPLVRVFWLRVFNTLTNEVGE